MSRPPGVKARANTAQQNFLGAVHKRLCRGMTQREIQQWALEQYEVPYKTTIKYIDKAKKENTRIFNEEMRDELGLALARFNHVYKVAMNTNQVYAAIDALKEILKLGGLGALKGKQDNLANGGTKQKIKLGDMELEL